MAQIKYNLGDLGGEEYSTNETIIGTWIDGKPLYRKVINLNCPKCPNEGTYADVSTDVSSLNIDYIIFKNVIINCPTIAILNYDSVDVGTDNGGTVWYDFADNSIYTRHNRVIYNGCTITAIIEYTKTTDVATT